MQKLMVFILVVFVGMQAHAFGGGDSRLFDKEWMRGVDAFALHFNGKGELDIKFSCDDKNASPDIYGVCSCRAGYLSENGKCVKDACANFKATECIKTCTSSNGIATYTYGTTCANGYFCNTNHQCENPCYEDECQTCTPNAGQAHWTNKANGTTCSIGSCQSGTCTNMCANKTLGECDASCHPATGVLTPKSSTALCGTDNNWHCDGNHNCVDPCAGQTAPACQKCVAVNGQATFVADDTQTTCHNGAYVCQSGACVNPCDSATYGECEQCTAVNGAAQISNKDTTTACGENGNYRCDGNGVCADPCKDADTPTCHECYVEQGVAKFRPISDTTCGDDDNYICQSGNCTDPCDLITNKNPCKDYTPQGGQCVESNKADTTVCPDGNGNNNYICQSGSCTDPCTIGEHASFEPTDCVTGHHAEKGECVLDYAEKGTACGEIMSGLVLGALRTQCDGKGDCGCPEQYYHTTFTGWCRHCSFLAGDKYSTQEYCMECNNTDNPREIREYNNEKYCVLITCPEKHFHGRVLRPMDTGDCVSCSDDYHYGYITTAEECAICDNTENPRFIGTNDNCYLCTHSVSITTTEEACNKCTNRTWTETTPASGTTPATGTCALAE